MKIILNKEQAHILNEFFRKYGTEQVWKIDNQIIKMVNDILEVNSSEENKNTPDNPGWKIALVFFYQFYACFVF